MPRPRVRFGLIAGIAVLGLIAGCSGPVPSPNASTTGPSEAASASAAAGTPTGSPAPSAPASASPSTGAVSGAPRLALESVVTGLDSPLDIAWRPDDPTALFIVEQGGQIRLVRAGALVDRPFLDIGGIVTAGGEQGLLGLAFPPDAGDRRFFVYYTAVDGQQVLAAYRTMPDDPDRADPDSGAILLRMPDRYANHNGGGLAFGPDGFLYISTGDGGGGGDPLDSGRHLDTLLAKILRIDVRANLAATADPPYAIPKDNPFVDTAGARPEIWLTGLRNPWRFHFDRATGDLWIGDVGQNEREEVDVARKGVGGLDFGWNLMEGSLCYRDGGAACLTSDLTLPVTEYGHDQGCAVIGGTVYRGAAQAGLRGWYVLSDNCSGRFWVLDPTRDDLRPPTFALDSGRAISSIAEDTGGELFATDLSGGELLRIVVDAG